MPPKSILDSGLLTQNPIIEHGIIQNQSISDEIIVEITRSRGVSETLGGERGNKFPYKIVSYEGVAIENLTHPDRVYEYE